MIEAKNEIDSLIYSTEKSVTDNADKLDAEIKAEVEKAIAEAKEVKDGEDADEIIAKKDALTQASMKIGQAIYGQQQQAAGEEDDGTVDAEAKEKTADADADKSEEDKKDEKK